MTRQQARLATFLREHLAQHGYAPSYDDMRLALGLRSKSGISRLVDALIAQGVVRKGAGVRALELVERDAGDSIISFELEVAVREYAKAVNMEPGGLLAAMVVEYLERHPPPEETETL